MIAVLEQGTSRCSRLASLSIAVKTGTAQNPHGPNHGWFIGFAPPDKPEIVVGALIEFAREGPYLAPLVSRAIADYLRIDDRSAAAMRVGAPAASAPPPFHAPGAPQHKMPATPD